MINLSSFQASQSDVGEGVELEIQRLHLMRVLGLVTSQRAVFGPFPLMRTRSRTAPTEASRRTISNSGYCSHLPTFIRLGFAQQQPGHHPAQLRQVALATGGALLTQEAGQLNKQLGMGFQGNLDWCRSPTLPWHPAHPMI